MSPVNLKQLIETLLLCCESLKCAYSYVLYVYPRQKFLLDNNDAVMSGWYWQNDDNHCFIMRALDGARYVVVLCLTFCVYVLIAKQNKSVKFCSRLSTACGWLQSLPQAVIKWRHLANDISWIQANRFIQYHACKKHKKTRVTLTFDLWPLYSVEFYRLQNFIELNTVVHELSCWQSFDDAENNTAVTSADSNDRQIQTSNVHANRAFDFF